MTPSSKLRSDHVAISLYNVTLRDPNTKSFNVQSSMNDTGSKSEIHIIGLESFLAVGMNAMKAQLFKCDFQTAAQYHFSGQWLPKHCQSVEGWKITTALVNASAYPGPASFWKASTTVTTTTSAILNDFVASGLVKQGEREGTYQITQFGFDNLTRSRQTHNHRQALKRRKHLALIELSQWELLDLLLDKGWQLLPMPVRKAVAPLALTAGQESIDIVYFNNQLEISKEYLVVCASTRQLADIGVQEVRHKQPLRYYASMLSILDAGQFLAIPAMPYQADDQLPIADELQQQPQQNMFAIEDGYFEDSEDDMREEGDPSLDEVDEDQENQDVPVVAAASSAGSERTTKWGPFSFRMVVTKAASGRIEMKVVARCPFHKDAGDAKGTACTRSCAFSGDGRENAENLLRQWCLMGRHVTHRACGPSDDSHKFLDPMNEVLQERSVQDAELQQAMLA